MPRDRKQRIGLESDSRKARVVEVMMKSGLLQYATGYYQQLLVGIDRHRISELERATERG